MMLKKLVKFVKSDLFCEILTYGIFGVGATAVNWVVYFIFCSLLDGVIENDSILAMVANPPAWIAGVVFAFITNKIWVFKSKNWEQNTLLKEIPEFVGARAITGVIEEFGLPVLLSIPFVENFDWKISIFSRDFDITNQVVAKVAIAVVVVILNYVFSKVVVFKKKKVGDAKKGKDKTEKTNIDANKN